MNLPFAQQPYFYSTTDLSIDSQHMYVASEGGLEYCSQQFFVVTQKNFKLFKLKKAYTGAQIITPVSEKTLEFINMINMFAPIGLNVLHNQNYKFAPHVRVMNEVLEGAIQVLPTRINVSQFMDQNYMAKIVPVLENTVNFLKQFSTSSVHRKDSEARKLWVSTQLKQVMSLFSKVYNTEQRANLVTITVNHLTLNTAPLTQDEIERNISTQVKKIVGTLLQENDAAIFHLFHKTYRDLLGVYYTQIFVITDQKFVFSTNSIALDHNQTIEINSANNQSTYMFTVNAVLLDLHGLDGLDQDHVKQSFLLFLSRHQYLYYKSKYISPEMIAVR